MPLSTRLIFYKGRKVKANSVAHDKQKELCIELELDFKTNLNHCCTNLVHREPSGPSSSRSLLPKIPSTVVLMFHS